MAEPGVNPSLSDSKCHALIQLNMKQTKTSTTCSSSKPPTRAKSNGRRDIFKRPEEHWQSGCLLSRENEGFVKLLEGIITSFFGKVLRVMMGRGKEKREDEAEKNLLHSVNLSSRAPPHRILLRMERDNIRKILKK